MAADDRHGSPGPTTTVRRSADGSDTLLTRLGRSAWALLGLLGVVVAVLYALGQVMLLVVPLVLALFPAALLEPVSRWLKQHRVPPSIAAILTIIGAIAVLAGIVAAVVPLVIAELPELIQTGEQGLRELQTFINEDPFGLGIGGVDELLDRSQEAVGQFGELTGQALQALVAVFETVAATLLMFVALFFYLKDDRRISRGFGDFVPARYRQDTTEIASRVWDTLGGFFRGQLLIAAVDAVFIGLGLVILGVPLALPLSILIFFGALFPIVGAFVTGTLAVLVALADSGLIRALIVLAIIVAVQQIEGNVLEPVVFGHVISLHPLVVIAAVTGGALTIGILGAFLAVPVVASCARVIEYLRERGTIQQSDAEDGAGARADVPTRAAT